MTTMMFGTVSVSEQFVTVLYMVRTVFIVRTVCSSKRKKERKDEIQQQHQQQWWLVGGDSSAVLLLLRYEE